NANAMRHSEDADSSERDLRWSDRMLRSTLRKAVEKSIEAGVLTLNKADTVLREAKLPKDIMNQMLAQVQGTKNLVVRGVAEEMRAFLLATDLANELHRVLTSLSFEIKTEIRFVPSANNAIKPEVRHATRAKRKSATRSKKSRSRRLTEHHK